MAKLAAKKKPTKPDAPKKPSSRSKTGNAECSQAASNWQLSIRGKATLNPGTYQTLAKCRALSKSGQMADAQGRTGKLSDQGAAALKGRLQKRFNAGLITQKARNERLNMLLKQRSERGKVETAVVAKPAMTAENKGTYGDYYFTPEGKYVSMSGSGGMGSNRVGARDINGKMIGWYDRKELRFANEKQRPTKESESASERLSEISKEVSGLREKNARLLIGRDTTDKLRRELSHGNITKEKYDELVKKGYALSDKDYALSGEVQKQIESVKSRLVQRGTETGGKAIPPAPARYSLQGKLAPGRGTEERNATAQFLSGMRKSGKLKASVVGRTSLMVAQDIRKGVQTPEALTDTLVTMRTKAFLEYPSEYRIRKGKSIGERMDFRIKHHESTDIIARHALGSKGYQEYARRVEEATKSEIQNQEQYFLDGYDKNYKPVKGAYKLVYPKLILGKPRKLAAR